MQTARIFSNMPKYIPFVHDGVPNGKEIQDFLNFNKKEISKATNVPETNVRYDDRMPDLLKQRLTEIATIIGLVLEYFENDMKQTVIWFQMSNPLLGDLSPRDMIRFGRYKKLLKFIMNSRAANYA